MKLAQAIDEITTVSDTFAFSDGVGGVDRANIDQLIEARAIPVQSSCAEQALLAAYFLNDAGFETWICRTSDDRKKRHVRCLFKCDEDDFLVCSKAGRYLVTPLSMANENVDEAYHYNGEDSLSELLGKKCRLQVAAFLRRIAPRYWPLDANRRKNRQKMELFNKRSQRVFLME